MGKDSREMEALDTLFTLVFHRALLRLLLQIGGYGAFFSALLALKFIFVSGKLRI